MRVFIPLIDLCIHNSRQIMRPCFGNQASRLSLVIGYMHPHRSTCWKARISSRATRSFRVKVFTSLVLSYASIISHNSGAPTEMSVSGSTISYNR